MIEAAATIGRVNTDLHVLCEIGVSKSSSSLIVRSLITTESLLSESGIILSRSDSKPRLIEVRSCDNWDGINVFTTRVETNFFFFRKLRAWSNSFG